MVGSLGPEKMSVLIASNSVPIFMMAMAVSCSGEKRYGESSSLLSAIMFSMSLTTVSAVKVVVRILNIVVISVDSPSGSRCCLSQLSSAGPSLGAVARRDVFMLMRRLEWLASAMVTTVESFACSCCDVFVVGTAKSCAAALLIASFTSSG